MSQPINASITAFANLLVIINAANTAQTITASQITAGTPAVQAADGQGRNTNLVLTAVGGQGYAGTVTVTYTRRPLNDSVASPNFNYVGTIGETAAAVIAAVASTNNLLASELTLVNQASGNAPVTGAITNSPASLTLLSNTGSLVYVDGSTQLITFTSWAAPQLSTAITTTALEGFDAA